MSTHHPKEEKLYRFGRAGTQTRPLFSISLPSLDEQSVDDRQLCLDFLQLLLRQEQSH